MAPGPSEERRVCGVRREVALVLAEHLAVDWGAESASGYEGREREKLL